MAKRPLDISKVTGLVNHGPTVLVSCSHDGKRNLITLAWTSPVSADPRLVAVAVAPGRFSHDLIRESREFVVNVPSSEILPAVWECGTVSGRDVDKFESAGLTAEQAQSVKAPLVAECFAHIECRVVAAPVLGDHTLFVGEVLAASAELEAFDGHLTLREPYHTLHHLGGRDFVTTAGVRLQAP